MNKILLLIVLMIVSSDSLLALPINQIPEVGKPCPNIVLKNIKYFSKKEATLSDFKGKWLILDFWSKGCSACVESFPKTNQLQNLFKGKVQFILIGTQDKENKIQLTYERFRVKENLTLPNCFDSTIANRWHIESYPQIIIVDDKGIVQGITYKIDSADIKQFLSGSHPDLPVSSNNNDSLVELNLAKPFWINGNGILNDSDYIHRSILTKFREKRESGHFRPISIYQHAIAPRQYPAGLFQVAGASLQELYYYAYFGRDGTSFEIDSALYNTCYYRPVLELKDSSLFETDNLGKNLFCYSLMIPDELGTKENLQAAMQRDLKTNFGFDASIEIRKMPYLRLIALEGATTKLHTRGGKQQIQEIIPHVSWAYSNVPMNQLLMWVMGYTDEQVVDDTGITGNIDFTTDFIDFDGLKSFLKKNGLSLVPAEKEMKVLVIRDPKN